MKQNFKQKVVAAAMAVSMVTGSVSPALAATYGYKNPSPVTQSYGDVSLTQEITKDNGDGTFDVTAKIAPKTGSVLDDASLSLELIMDVDKSGSMDEYLTGVDAAMNNFIDYAITNNPNKNVKIGFVGYDPNFTPGSFEGEDLDGNPKTYYFMPEGDDLFTPTNDVSAIKSGYESSGQSSSFKNVQTALDYFASSSATNKVFIEISDAAVDDVTVNIPSDVTSYGILTTSIPDHYRDTMLGVVTSPSHVYDAESGSQVESALKEIFDKALGGAPEPQSITGEATFDIPEGFELVGVPNADKGNASDSGKSISWSSLDLSQGAATMTYTIKRTSEGESAPINSKAELSLSNGSTNAFPIPEVEAIPDPLIPSIKVDKKADKTTVGNIGDTINYEIVVTNDGESELSNITLTDSLVSDVKLNKDSLKPGESDTISYSYTVENADFDKESVDNTVKVEAKDPEGKSVSSTSAATVGVNEILGSISFTKVGFDGEPLEGIKFTLKNVETGETEEVITGEDGVVNYTGLKLGDYTVSETAINNLIPVEDLEATLTREEYDADLDKVVNDKARIKLTKLGEDDGTEIEVVNDEYSNEEEKDKSEDSGEKSEEVEEEKETAESKSFFVKIASFFTPKSINSDDSKEEVEESKDAKGKVLSGVKFELFDGEDLLTEIETDKNGEALLDEIPVGKNLTLKEVEAAEGYQKLNDDINFSIDREGNIVLGEISEDLNGEVSKDDDSINILDYLYEVSEAEITKIDAESKDVLEGAEFSLYLKGDSEALETAKTDKDGKVKFEYIGEGDYVIKETKAPEGYKGTDKEFEFSVDPYKSEVFEETFENEKIVEPVIEPENPYKKVQTDDGSNTAQTGLFVIAGVLVLGGVAYVINKKKVNA